MPCARGRPRHSRPRAGSLMMDRTSGVTTARSTIRDTRPRRDGPDCQAGVDTRGRNSAHTARQPSTQSNGPGARVFHSSATAP